MQVTLQWKERAAFGEASADDVFVGKEDNLIVGFSELQRRLGKCIEGLETGKMLYEGYEMPVF